MLINDHNALQVVNEYLTSVVKVAWSWLSSSSLSIAHSVFLKENTFFPEKKKKLILYKVTGRFFKNSENFISDKARNKN